jgi:S-adenosyl methyltransferase
VAQGVDPAARVVYVDDDPIVLVHARALLTSSPEGATAYIDADLRDPERSLTDPDLRQTLDLSQPVALTLAAILHFIPDEDDPYGIVSRLVAALPAGSYLVLSHVTYDYLPPDTVAQLESVRVSSAEPFRARTRAEVARFFEGMQPVEPGIVSVVDWHAEHEPGPARARRRRRSTAGSPGSADPGRQNRSGAPTTGRRRTGGAPGSAGTVTGRTAVLPAYAASLAARTRRIRCPAGQRVTVPGSWMCTTRVTSATRTGETMRSGSVTEPSGATSYSLAKRTSCPDGPAVWLSAAAGQSSRTSRVGTPTVTASAASGGVVQAAKVPGASVGGVSGSGTWLPCTAEVSE